MKRTKTIRVSEEFAEFMEGLRTAIQVDTGRKYSYPDFSNLLLDDLFGGTRKRKGKKKYHVFFSSVKI